MILTPNSNQPDDITASSLNSNQLGDAATSPSEHDQPDDTTPSSSEHNQPDNDEQPRNPYKGLRAFTTDDARDFFDRATFIDALALSIETMLTHEKKGDSSSRLLAIIGPSGSGKSSLAMAGLLPCLRTGGVFDSEDWIYLPPLVPTEHPMASLALALSQHTDQKDSQHDDLQDTAALHLYSAELTKQTNGRSTHVVLVVDQFEELLTLTSDEEERQHFLDLLVNACTRPGGPLIVVLTLRTDFANGFAAYPDFHALIQRHQEHYATLWPMTQDDLRTVITQPALLPDVRISFEDGLVDMLLVDARGQTEILPHLQFTLDELFRMRVGRQLTLQAYSALDGLKGALSQRAEHIYQALPSDEHRLSAKILFLHLIDPGTPARAPTLRRTLLSTFDSEQTAQTVQTQPMQETIAAFINARLLTTDNAVDTTTIEIGHEVVLRAWPRLANWLRVVREDIQLRQTLSEDALAWEQQAQPERQLYRGIQLRQAVTWAARHMANERESNFLQASLVRHTRLLTVRIIIAALLLILLAGAAGAYYRSQQSATLLVTNMGNSGQGSLRWCIENAATKSTITFDPHLKGILTFSGGNLAVPQDKNLTIQGPGARQLVIRSGDTSSTIDISGSLTISDLSFQSSQLTNRSIFSNRGSLTLNNTAIANNTSSGNGGAIYSSGGSLTLNNTTVANNTSNGDGGAIYLFKGKLTLNHSSISGNTSSKGKGGAIFLSGGTLTMDNSTLSANAASANSGGGIYVSNSTLTLNNDTISGNLANIDGGGLSSSNSVLTINESTIFGNAAITNGGGLSINAANTSAGNAPVIVEKSIIASNQAEQGPDVSGTLITNGYNLLESFSGANFIDPQNLHGTDKEINNLADIHIDASLNKNGGPTLTHALQQGSPAIDAIPLSACDLKTNPTDQRGVKRPQGNACDIGAYEYQSHS